MGDVIDFVWAINVQNVNHLQSNEAELTGSANWTFLVAGFVFPVGVVVLALVTVLSMLLSALP